MKKGFIAMIALTVFLALGFGFSESADAKRGGGFKSPKQSFTQNKNKDTGAQQSNSGNNANSSGTRANPSTNPATGGLFGGGGFLKGMMIGGLAGMLFGGMFANMGAFGELLGLLINVAAIVAIFMIIRAAFVYIRSKNSPAANGYQNRDDDRNNRGPF